MAEKPLLTVIVATKGRETLPRTFASIEQQEGASRAEVLVIGDTFRGPLPEVEQLVRSMGPRYRYVGFDARRACWGNIQRNIANRFARGLWISYIDDDDIYTREAFPIIFGAIQELPSPRPLLFRFMSPWRKALWDEQELRVGNISGQCIVFPNHPTRIGVWEPDYVGDFAFIRSTIDLWGGTCTWREELIAWTRPTDGEDWTRPE